MRLLKLLVAGLASASAILAQQTIDQRRFSGIGQADQTDIGDQFQAQPKPAFDALQAGIGTPRGLVDRRFEMGVAESAIAAAQDEARYVAMSEKQLSREIRVLEKNGFHRFGHSRCSIQLHRQWFDLLYFEAHAQPQAPAAPVRTGPAAIRRQFGDRRPNALAYGRVLAICCAQ